MGIDEERPHTAKYTVDEYGFPYRLGYLQSAVESGIGELEVVIEYHRDAGYDTRATVGAVIDRLRSALAVSNRDGRG